MALDSILLCQFLILGIVANGIPTSYEYARTKAGVDQSIKDAAKAIVKKSKAEAHVDTGRLKRSIAWVIDYNGVTTFTEAFYGQFHENSNLEENIKSMFPSGQPYNLIYTDDNGMPYQVVRKSGSGRTAVTNATKSTTRRSLGIAGIKNFLKKFIDGKEKDGGADPI